MFLLLILVVTSAVAFTPECKVKAGFRIGGTLFPEFSLQDIQKNHAKEHEIMRFTTLATSDEWLRFDIHSSNNTVAELLGSFVNGDNYKLNRVNLFTNGTICDYDTPKNVIQKGNPVEIEIIFDKGLY